MRPVHKPSYYYAHPRPDVRALVPSEAKHILDVGCGIGALGSALKATRQVEVVGIEWGVEAANRAKGRIDSVICGDVEAVSVPYPDRYFDCIVYADILEHLINPLAVLIQHRRCLADDGRIVVSVPNVAHYSVVVGLLRGKWEYATRGILDETHLRFFTRRGIISMLCLGGYKIERLAREYRLFDDLPNQYATLAKVLSLYVFRDFLTFRYLILAGKMTE